VTTQSSVVAASTSELAEKFGAAGLRVGHYTKDEKELWLLRRYLFTLAANQLLPFPVHVIRSERPDFIISFGGKAPAALEITEGTHSSDARERSLARTIGGIHLIGQLGGRGSGGFVGDKPERLWCADVIRALRRKLRKPYANRRFTLLIYTNSNPALVVHAGSAARMLLAKLDGRTISGIELSGIHISIISGDYLIYNATLDPQLFVLVKELE
jgi:hypothetical protein